MIYPAQPEQILKSLGKLWTSLGQEEKEHGKPTVLRACAMTLIVATNEPDGGFSSSQIISELMHEHPSRGIVLTVSDRAEKDLEARVFAQCWKPFGKAQQICCEQIEITARPQSWGHVGPTLIGLLVADLPVVFWCRHVEALGANATPDQEAGLEAVMRLATKTIVDTKDQDSASSVRRIAEWRALGRHVADLEWTRLTPWREPIARLFDSGREYPYSSFERVEIAYANETIPASALYLAGWLAHPFQAKVSFAKTNGCSPGVQRVTLESPREKIEFMRNGCDCMTLRSTRAPERNYSYSEATPQNLMNEELAVIGSDPAFDAAFESAREILRDGL